MDGLAPIVVHKCVLVTYAQSRIGFYMLYVGKMLLPLLFLALVALCYAAALAYVKRTPWV